MKFLKRHYLVCFLSILLVAYTACTKTAPTKDGSTIEDVDTMRITNPINPSNLLLSNVVDSISIIKLETTDKSLMSRVSNIKFHEDRIFISDAATNQLLVFDKDGRFLKSLHAVGKGPQEYIRLADFAIDGNSIYILDVARKSIVVYDLELNFEKRIRITNTSINIEVLNNEIWLYNAYGQTYGADFELAKIDSYHREYSYLRREKYGNYGPEDITLWGGGNVFSVSDGFIYYSERYGNDILELKEESISTNWRIDFDKYTIPESTNPFFETNISYAKWFPYILKGFFAVSDKYVVIRFYDSKGRPCYAFQDKKSKVTEEGFIINDIIKGYNKFAPSFGQDNILIEPISAHLIFNENFKGIIDYFPSLKKVRDDDNDILIKYHLKK